MNVGSNTMRAVQELSGRIGRKCVWESQCLAHVHVQVPPLQLCLRVIQVVRRCSSSVQNRGTAHAAALARAPSLLE